MVFSQYFVKVYFSILVLFCIPCDNLMILQDNGLCERRIDDGSRMFVACQNVTSEEQLQQYIEINSDAKDFELKESTLRFISHDAFMGTKVEGITILETTLLSLTDTSSAFDGLESSLRWLYIRRCNLTNNWNWNHLRNLKNLTSLSIWKADIDYLTVFPELALEYLDLVDCNIHEISPNAFSDLNNLIQLDLQNNSISTVERSCFPKTAGRLNFINLAFNKIRIFPADVFTDMPALTGLGLEGNQLHTIAEDVFKPIFTQLEALQMSWKLNNPLICDCRLKWIMKMKTMPEYFDAKCSSPKHLEEIMVKHLMSSDLSC